MVTDELTQRRAELDRYSSRIEQALTDPMMQLEVQRAKAYEVRGTIGSLACCSFIVEGEDKALDLAEYLLDRTGSDEYIAKSVYGELAKEGSKKSVEKYRSLIEASRSKIGEDDSYDENYNLYWYCDDLVELYKMGDEVAGATARELIEEADADELEGFGARAVKLFQAGDESAFPLLLDTTDKAIAHHYSEESKKSEVSEAERLLAAISRSAVPAREAVPGSNVIKHLTIYIKSLAVDLIKKGDLARAEELQSRLPKEIDRVHLDAIKIAEGLDETGKYTDSVIHAVESQLIVDPSYDGQAIFEVLEASALAGNADVILQFKTIVQKELEEQDVSSYGINSAHALWKAGKMSEEDFEKVLSAVQSPSHKCEILVNLGRTEEALQIVRSEFAKNPRDVSNAYGLLRYEYNEEAMSIVQDAVGEFDFNPIAVVNRRAGWLKELARHIKKISDGSVTFH